MNDLDRALLQAAASRTRSALTAVRIVAGADAAGRRPELRRADRAVTRALAAVEACTRTDGRVR